MKARYTHASTIYKVEWLISGLVYRLNFPRSVFLEKYILILDTFTAKKIIKKLPHL